MGDLMSGSSTFDSLVKSYDQFRTPAIKVKIDGSEIKSGLQSVLSEMDITLTLDEASSASFSLIHIYDLEKRAINSQIKKSVVVGATVTVELGYGSSLTEVFSGYISNVTMTFSDMPTISVTALDMRRLMMDNTRNNYRYEVKHYSEVATKVFSAYKKVCPKAVVDGTTDQLTQVMQTGNDYEFIKHVIGPKANREFFVVGGTAYFRKIGSGKTPITTLEWGKGLLSFSTSVSYRNETIKIYGYNDDKKESVLAEKTIKSDSQLKSVVTPVPFVEIQSSVVDSQAKAKEMAEFEGAERLKQSRSGSGSAIGLPELIPGRYIKIEGVDSSVNKTYYLTQVKHLFGEDGYTTQFEIGGWL